MITRFVKYQLVVLILLTSKFTGAQPVDSVVTTRNDVQTKKILPSLVLISAGIITTIKWPNSIDEQITGERNEHLIRFDLHADDYLQFLPLAFSFSSEAFGMKSRTDFKNRTAITFKSQLLTTVVVTSIKYAVKRKRPDGSANNSFPSGHSATAFAAATLMSEELGQRYKWSPYLAYALAGSVAMLRVFNNKHYLGDVLVGAGLGILSTHIVYHTHRYRWSNTKQKRIL